MDIEAIKKSKFFVYYLDQYNSRGKLFELGYAHALNKKIIIYLDIDHIAHIPIERSGIMRHFINNQSIFIKSNLFPIIDKLEDLKFWLKDNE